MADVVADRTAVARVADGITVIWLDASSVDSGSDQDQPGEPRGNALFAPITNGPTSCAVELDVPSSGGVSPARAIVRVLPSTLMENKLDVLEHALRELVDASGPVGLQTQMDHRLHDRRINIDRHWGGNRRWVYITWSVDQGDTLGLFLGWSSDPPGHVFWESRFLADLAGAKDLVRLWVLEGAAPELLLSVPRPE